MQPGRSDECEDEASGGSTSATDTGTASNSAGSGGSVGRAVGGDGTGGVATSDSSQSSQGGAETGQGGGSPNAASSDGGAGEGGAPSSNGGPGTSTDAGSGSGCVGDNDCLLEIVTDSTLPSVCARAELEVQLVANCSCDDASTRRDINWHVLNNSLPAGLALAADGSLSGTAPPGNHEFSALVSIDGFWQLERDFHFTAWERCHAFYLTDEGSEQAHVAAGRLDTGEVTHLTPTLGMQAVVTAFDVSPDGAFLIQIEELGAERQLVLFHVSGPALAKVDLGLAGNYLTHAFSRDSRWLAFITSNPHGPLPNLLQVIDLTTSAASLLDPWPVEHHAGLDFSELGRIIYRGPSEFEPFIFDATYEALVTEAGIGEPIEMGGTWASNADPLGRFVVAANGFATLLRDTFFYYNRPETILHLPPPDAIAPALGWAASMVNDGLRLDPFGSDFVAGDAYASVKSCGAVLGWSRDDSTFVCHSDAGLEAFEVGPAGALQGTPLGLNFPAPSMRVALSDDGSWLTLTQTSVGLLVVPTDGSQNGAQPAAQLEPPTESSGWDFFFTPSRPQLVIQRERQLFISDGSLDPQTTPVQIEDITLRAVPSCEQTWRPDPDTWCGAPRFKGNTVLSRAETHIAFATEQGDAASVDLETLEPTTFGPVSETCTQSCVKLQ